MYLSKNLRQLRLNNGLTQDELAALVGVPGQAVSKWERGECYPDIEFLPKIASYYDVSVDDLLGVGEMKKQERIKEYYEEKSSKFCNIGDRKSDLELWREARKEFPNDWTVLYNLQNALFYMCCFSRDKEIAGEAIEIGEKILSQCTENVYRYSAIQTMCFLYSNMGEREKAKKYVEMAPHYTVSRDMLLNSVLNGDEWFTHTQSNIVWLCKELAGHIEIYVRSGNLNYEAAKALLSKSLKIYELIYEDGDYGFYNDRLDTIYTTLAVKAADQSLLNETIENLSNAVNCAVKFDTTEELVHTSTLVNRMDYSRKGIQRSDMSNNSNDKLQALKDKRYDFCRNDDRFIKLIENLQKFAVSGK